MSLIREAQATLRELRAAHLAVDVIYMRGYPLGAFVDNRNVYGSVYYVGPSSGTPSGSGTAAQIKATQAVTTVTVDDGQQIAKSKVSDWLIDVLTLTMFGKPLRGDQIDYEGVRYEVADVIGEHCWRWHGTDQKTFRIHTQHVPLTERTL